MSTKSRPKASSTDFSMEDFEKALESETYQFQTGQVIQGSIFRHESNGVYVDVRGKSLAFLPIDEVVLNHGNTLLEQFPLESRGEFMIIKEQNDEGQITLSLRRLQIKKAWEQLVEMQQSQQSLTVRVSGVNKGGVTADFQGIRGFIPRSHLLDKENLDALKGKTLTVGLLEVNPNTNKLVLSERAAARAASMGQFAIGQLISGRVSSIKPFGLFVDFGNASGLLHINQISKTYINSLTELFQTGQPIKAVITDIDEGKGRIALSTKILENFPGEMVRQMDEVMANAEARLKQINGDREVPADPGASEEAGDDAAAQNPGAPGSDT